MAVKRKRMAPVRRKTARSNYVRRVKKRAPARRYRRSGRGTMQRHAAPVAVGTSVAHGKRGPGGIGYSMTQVSDTCTRIVGRAYVGEVTTAGKVASAAIQKNNAVGLVFDINPSLLNDRVAVISSTFSKYVYHAVKFTYVPQCSTATSGSIALAFERDPLAIAANTQGSQFLSEVMSYEHAVLTPTYVGASTAYARDPKELKTWFLGGPDATMSTRETSQGQLLCYVSNAPETEGGLGFIVMDYVLDLVAPTLLPNKQGITRVTGAPSQWRDLGVPSVRTPRAMAGSNYLRVPFSGGAAAAAQWHIASSWLTDAGFDADAVAPGVVGEIIIGGGISPDAAPSFACTPVNGTNIQENWYSTLGNPVFLKQGQKLYFTVHAGVNDNADPTPDTAFSVTSFHTTLSSAKAAASLHMDNLGVAPVATILPDMLCAKNLPTYLAVNGWCRLICEGSGSEDNA